MTAKSSGPHNLIRDSRRRLGLTQRHLAELLRYRDRSVIAHWERGAKSPALLEALKLEIIFGRPVSEIFSRVRRVAWREIVKQLNEKLLLSGCLQPRVSYKPGQLADVLASFGRQRSAPSRKRPCAAREDSEY